MEEDTYGPHTVALVALSAPSSSLLTASGTGGGAFSHFWLLQTTCQSSHTALLPLTCNCSPSSCLTLVGPQMVGSSLLPSVLHLRPMHPALPHASFLLILRWKRRWRDQTDEKRRSSCPWLEPSGSPLLLVVLGCAGAQTLCVQSAPEGLLEAPLGTSALHLPLIWVMHSDWLLSVLALPPVVHLQP
jgi:hypothetical protein